MVKPLRFKGDPKPKKRKRTTTTADGNTAVATPAAETSATTLTAEEADNAWVLAETIDDVRGPAVLVLPTTPPSALACDGAGKVFRMGVENLVDGIASSAEPHDVRMVWQVNRAIGAADKFRLKSHHDRFLSMDKSGILSATGEVMSSFETFEILPLKLAWSGASNAEGKFVVRSTAGQYLKVTKSSVGGDDEVSDESLEEEAAVLVKIQARFKTRLQADKAGLIKDKISRKALEEKVGRPLQDGEVRMLKRARREGDFNEKVLDLKVKDKHDKWG